MSQTVSNVRPHDQSDRRRLLRAVKHVAYLWLPFNPEVLEQLQDGKLFESASEDPERLLTVLREDCGLLAFLLVRLMQDVRETSLVPLNKLGPTPLLSSAGPDRIRQLVAEGRQISSVHQLRSARPFQLSRLAETIVVASTVESLCRSRQLDPNTGFCRAVLRELGLNLIAWNYPSVFQRTIESLEPFQRIEEAIRDQLGFLPEDLAHGLMFPSNPPLEHGPRGLDPQDQLHDDFIAVGQALARAEFPEIYSSSNRDWHYACTRLKENLGRLFPSGVKEAIKRNSSSYYRAFPQHFTRLRNFDPARHHRSRSGPSRIVSNPFVKACSAPIQDALTDLYDNMPDNVPDQAGLTTLLTKVVPQAGFTGGCLFLLSKRTGSLVPSTIIGKVRGLSTNPVILIAASENPGERTQTLQRARGGTRSIVERAFVSRRPIMERVDHMVELEKDRSPEVEMYRFSATIGERRPVGVLYLERPISNDTEEETRAFPTFRAINKSLSDALFVD